MNPEKTALVLVELQRQWTDPGLYRMLISRQMRRVEAMLAAAEQARTDGVLVVHAPLVLDPAAKRGAFAHLTQARVFRKGSTRAELTPGAWREGDVLVTGRTSFDAFTDSTLESVLRGSGIETLMVAGFTTDQCVSRTLRTARKLGFEAWLLSDCCATFNGAVERRTLRRHAPYVMSAQS